MVKNSHNKRSKKEGLKERENTVVPNASPLQEEIDYSKLSHKKMKTNVDDEFDELKVINEEDAKTTNNSLESLEEPLWSLCCEYIWPIVPDKGLLLVKWRMCREDFHTRWCGINNINKSKDKKKTK